MKKMAVVGSGPAGSTFARLAADLNYKVDIFDRRDHIAGNCFDSTRQNGVLVHNYGPHFFRSSSIELLDWLSQFTDWIPAQYLVRALSNGRLLPLPISLSTMTALTGEYFTEEKFKKYLNEKAVHIDNVKNAEDHCLKTFGVELYDAIFKNYTKKQWGVMPDKLSPTITSRIPIRFNYDEKYVDEPYQLMPRDGYTSMFKEMLHHKNISIHLNEEIDRARIDEMKKNYQIIIYTGPIDAYFNKSFGALPYRSLRFEFKDFDSPYMQPVPSINYPNEHDYTRIVEIKHVTGQISNKTTLCYEYPASGGDPFYPILIPENIQLFNKYHQLALEEEKGTTPVIFIGRLADYKYYNMDHIHVRAMKLAEKILK